jgi:curved DNA-binding protein CbpA
LARLLRRYALQPSSSTRSTAADSGTVVRLSTARASTSVQEANTFDLYKILGISSEASALEIKVAFRKLAKALHPDRNPGDQIAEKQFAALHEAYTILGNAELRAIYDSEMERIRRSAEIQRAEADGGDAARRDRRTWHEAAKMAAATVVLTACLITGISIWQQNSSGLQRNHAVVPDPGPLKPYISPDISREQLAEALFGSQASHYADAAAAPSKKAIAANASTAANSEAGHQSRAAITPGSEPAAAGNKETVASTEATAPSSEAKAASVEAAASGIVAVVSSARAAVLEPTAPLPATEVALAVEPNSPAKATVATAAPSKGFDQAARAQAERLIGLGERHLADGNVAIARQYFVRAFDLGFAQAAIRLAETFEAQTLARHGVHGVKPNPTEAEKWRRRALELVQ